MNTVYSIGIFIIIQVGRFLLAKIRAFRAISHILHFVSVLWAILPWLPEQFQAFGFFLALLASVLFVLRLMSKVFCLKLKTPPLPTVLVEIVLLVVIFLVLINTVVGVKLTGLVISSAVLTAVIGFALQDILSSLFYGIVFSIERPFKIGEWVSIADQTGKISKINWRAVYIKTLDNRTVIVPNSMVSRQEIINYSYPDPLLRRSVRVGVGYQFAPDLVRNALLDAVRDVDKALKSPSPDVDLVEFGDHAIIYELRFWIDQYEDYLEAEDAVSAKIWYTFRREGIEIPFPIRTVYLKETAAAADADKEAFVRKIQILKILTDEEVTALAGRARLEHYAEAETVVHQGDEGNCLYIITAGEAEVLHLDESGDAKLINELKAGSVFGEMSLLTGERRSATVRAKTRLDVMVIDKKGFKEILLRNPTLAESLSRMLAERQQDLMVKKQRLTKEEELKTAKTLFDRIRYFFGI